MAEQSSGALHPERTIQPDPHRWWVFAVFSAVYFFVFYHRVSTSVIAADLMLAFDVQATALGVMSSMYFYLYAVEQPLVGYLADRWGPRRVVGYWSTIATAGCLIFALAPDIFWASVGRALIGFGVGGVYVPAMKAFSQWFRRNEFGTLVGLLLAAGNLGAMVATAPLAVMAESWGWRITFLFIGGLTLGLAACALFGLRDHPARNAGPRPLVPTAQGEGRGNRRAPVRDILTSRNFWILGTMFAVLFGTNITFQGLWAAPFLMSVLEIGRMQASNLNMLIPVGVIVGAPLWGWVVEKVFLNKAAILSFLMVLQTALWLAFTLWGEVMGAGAMIGLFLFMGVITGGLATTLWSFVRETTPEEILGSTSGLLNPFPLMGGGLMQSVSGAILDRADQVGGLYPAGAYRAVFLLFLASSAVCLALSIWLRAHPPREAD